MDTSGATYEELVTIMGHIMPEPEVEIREGLTAALWRFSVATGQAAGQLRAIGGDIVDGFVRGINACSQAIVNHAKLHRELLRKVRRTTAYQRRAARLNARPRPSKRHGERRGVK